MRRDERKIQDIAAVETLLRRCQTVCLALWDGSRPYAVTVNFGYKDGVLYFHCAPEGRKADCLRANGLVSFQAVEQYELVRAVKNCGYTAHFRSVSGFGRAEFVTDEAEKTLGMDVIMAQHGAKTGGYAPEVLARTAVVRVLVEELTGKANPAWQGDPASSGD